MSGIYDDRSRKASENRSETVYGCGAGFWQRWIDGGEGVRERGSEVFRVSQKEKVDMRSAALMIGINRVAQACHGVDSTRNGALVPRVPTGSMACAMMA